jgi:Domain of unknown function (DUF4893)
MDSNVRRAALLLAAFAVAGCGAAVARPAPKPAIPGSWKRMVTSSDLNRLRNWREAFVAAIAQAKAGGNGAAVAREGALLVPDAAIEPVGFAAGMYRCRTIKLGSGGPDQGGSNTLSYVAYPAFDCRVTDEGGAMRLTKTTGSQRPVGLVFDDSPMRKIFLGTLMLGDEARPFAYGTDADRDMAGAIQRVGEKRWRLILPYPKFESTMDVIELVPKN